MGNETFYGDGLGDRTIEKAAWSSVESKALIEYACLMSDPCTMFYRIFDQDQKKAVRNEETITHLKSFGHSSIEYRRA